MTVASGVLPLIKGQWKVDRLTRVFILLKLLGGLLAVMTVVQVGPEFLLVADAMPFLFYKVVTLIAIIIPIGAVFLALLVDYGLMECIGVLLQPIMRPVWKVPGRSAVDAAASFAGSYSIGLLITNRVYKEGRYSAKEAAIIATSFSSVSAAFMVIVARTLDLIDIWNTFFWVTLAVTFAVSAIVVRLPPLSRVEDEYFENTVPAVAPYDSRHLFKRALSAGLNSAARGKPFVNSAMENVRDGLKMVLTVAPMVMSIGTLALMIVKYTPLFDILGYVFYPVTAVMALPEAKQVASAVAATLPDMFIPAVMSVDLSFVSRFVVGVVSISSIIFFDGSIPCILATEIPIKLRTLVIIWFQRAVLSIVLASPAAFSVEYFLRQ